MNRPPPPSTATDRAAPAHPHAPQTHPLLLALSLLLIACNLRPVFGSLSVVLPDIMRDTGLSATGASLLTTLPISFAWAFFRRPRLPWHGVLGWSARCWAPCC